MYEDEGLQNLKSALSASYRIGKELYDILSRINSNKESKTEAAPVNNESFVFTGKPTDLIFFDENEHLSKGVIDSIEDPKIKNALLDNLIRAEQRGLIDVDLDNGSISLTSKGEKYTANEDFKKAAFNDQKEALKNPDLTEQPYGVELNGTDTDLNYFVYGKELDMKAIALNSNTETAKKIFINAGKWQENGLVELTKRNTLTLTEKGRQMIKSPAFTLANGRLAEKAFTAIPVAGKVFAVTKTLFKATNSLTQSMTQANNKQKGKTL